MSALSLEKTKTTLQDQEFILLKRFRFLPCVNNAYITKNNYKQVVFSIFCGKEFELDIKPILNVIPKQFLRIEKICIEAENKIVKVTLKHRS